MRFIASFLATMVGLIIQPLFAGTFLYLNGVYSPQTSFGPNPSGGDLQVHEPMWVEYKGQWVYPSHEPDPSLLWISSLITSAYNADSELTKNGEEGCYSYEPVAPQYSNHNGFQAPTVTFARLLSGCSDEEKKGAGKVYKSTRLYTCPDGHEPLDNQFPISCVPIPVCECNENLIGNECIPMEPLSEYEAVPGESRVYEYPDNNHDDAERCPAKNFPESDSKYQCKKSKTNSTHVGNPIDCATGQKVQTEVDYIGFGLDALTQVRRYVSGSSDLENSARWELSISHPSLTTTVFKDGARLLTFRSGGQRLVSAVDTPKEDLQTSMSLAAVRHIFVPAGKSFGTTNSKHSEIKYSDESVTYLGKKYDFSETNKVKHYESISDKSPKFTYEYIVVDNKKLLKKKVNRFGRFLEYSYDDTGTLISVFDQEGRGVQYGYDDKNLVRATFMDDTPETLEDNPFRSYLFENGKFPSLLTGIIDENGKRFATYRYGENGKAVSTEHFDGAEKVEVSYPEDGKAIVKFYRDVTSDSYREEHYTFGKFRGKYKLTSKEIKKCEMCQLTTEIWEYGEDYGLLVRHVEPSGSETTYSYITGGRMANKVVAVGTPQETSVHYVWDSRFDKIIHEISKTERKSYFRDANGNLTHVEVAPFITSTAD